MTVEDNIKKLNINLPAAPEPVGSYVATKIVGKLLYISGQVSINEKGEFIKGKVGEELNLDEGYEAAKRCALNIISQAKKACDNDLSRIKSCVKLTGYVNSTNNFKSSFNLSSRVPSTIGLVARINSNIFIVSNSSG